MLTEAEAAADVKNYAEPTGGISSGAFDQRARWFIIPLNNGSGRYMFVTLIVLPLNSIPEADCPSISPTSNKKFSLNVHSAAHSKNGNKVIVYATKDDASHWYLKLAPDAISNSPRYQETL